MKIVVLQLFETSGFATTHVVVSVRHPITYQSAHPLTTKPRKYVETSYWRIKIDR